MNGVYGLKPTPYLSEEYIFTYLIDQNFLS